MSPLRSAPGSAGWSRARQPKPCCVTTPERSERFRSWDCRRSPGRAADPFASLLDGLLPSLISVRVTGVVMAIPALLPPLVLVLMPNVARRVIYNRSAQKPRESRKPQWDQSFTEPAGHRRIACYRTITGSGQIFFNGPFAVVRNLVCPDQRGDLARQARLQTPVDLYRPMASDPYLVILESVEPEVAAVDEAPASNDHLKGSAKILWFSTERPTRCRKGSAVPRCITATSTTTPADSI